MPDRRSRAEKLRAMASQTAQSPHEAEIAKRLLEEMKGAGNKIPGGNTPGVDAKDEWTIRQETRTGRRTGWRPAYSGYDARWEAAGQAPHYQDDLGRDFHDDFMKWWGEQVKTQSHCPGCKHTESSHAGFTCYLCGYCGWAVFGEGNNWGVKPGWHRFSEFTE